MMPTHAPARSARAGSGRRLAVIGLLTLAGTALLGALGLWQLERRAWKLDLVRAVQTRFRAPVQALPAVGADIADHTYEHVEATGTWQSGRDTWVHAATEQGTGYWILSPLRLPDGRVVLINRGFVPEDSPRDALAADPRTHVVGVLRASEPAGVWPRHNDPAQERWYSRDVGAIATARGLARVAPYFIDADAQPDPPGAGGVWPVGGLTVVHFRNAHLSYALTWFALALMTLGAGGYLLRGEVLGTARGA